MGYNPSSHLIASVASRHFCTVQVQHVVSIPRQNSNRVLRKLLLGQPLYDIGRKCEISSNTDSKQESQQLMGWMRNSPSSLDAAIFI